MSPTELKILETQLWKSADDLRANSDLAASEYDTPVLGLIFLKFADGKFKQHLPAIQAEYDKLKGGRREKPIEDIALELCGFYLPEEARYDYLLGLPEDANIAQALKDAMTAIEQHKPELEGVLPKDEYFALTRNLQNTGLPNRLLKNFANIPDDADGDLFGQIYEYFLGKFALAEGQGGGEFFTPTSVVRLMVEIIEPHGGSVFDPACGSGGMFVQSARFIEEHRKALKSADELDQGDLDLFVCGQEKFLRTVKLAKMNLAVNGLRGDIHQAISYYEDPANSLGRFDYVLANPPFNVDEVIYNGVKDDPRFNTYGIPKRKTKSKGKAEEETVPNANYLWINLFATSLKDAGRAALVMANSASDARHSEADIRRELIEQNLIYGMLTLPSNMFYTVTLPATLWFFDKGKAARGLEGDHAERILFIDARNVFTQIDRAHREFSPAQIQNLATISRLYCGQRGSFIDLIDCYFADGMQRLTANAEAAPAVTDQVAELIDDADCARAAQALREQWTTYPALQQAWADYEQGDKAGDVDARNTRQRTLAEPFAAFFASLHDRQKTLDKAIRGWERVQAEKNSGRRKPDRDMKALKTAMDTLHADMRDAEQCFAHIEWLQSRFPEARYEDVVGLCKAATQAEIEEQDWSLNPGRYVGVVIEEDGKTEEEFRQTLEEQITELTALSESASQLESIIIANFENIMDQG